MDIFDHTDLEEFTAAVLGYIKYCIDPFAVRKDYVAMGKSAASHDLASIVT